jgi:hypothetical protein
MTQSRISAEQESATLTRFRQPAEALVPEAFKLEAIEHWGLAATSHLPADLFRLTSFWSLEYIRQHVPDERKTLYAMRLAQAESYGVAFDLAPVGRHPEASIVGEDSRHILKERRYRDDLDRTALLDLVIAATAAAPICTVTLDQTLRDKYLLRARLFADEAKLVLLRKGLGAVKGARPHIHIVGATAGIISALRSRGYDVTATDLSPTVVGQNLGGVSVSDATENASLIKAADLVIITGMSLCNRTLPALIDVAKTCNTSTLLWAVTGRNLGQYYIQHGVDCVISDPSPFLLLPGSARIGIWRRDV